jgi:2-keto-4-pentenoate hydratase
MSKIDHIAEYMLNQHQNREAFKNLPENLKPSNIDEAYKAQILFQKKSGRGDLGGFKIALASKIQQELCGIDHPIAGGIFNNEIKSSPTTFQLNNFHGLGLEFEIAITLSHELNSEMGLFDTNNIRKYIKCLSPAFELIIDRGADYSNIDALTMITDNAWCSGIVLGEELPNWENLNLEKLKSKLFWNKEVPQDALINDANPLESLSWVANLLISQGRVIPKNSVIITGSVIKTRAPLINDHIIYNVGGLSEVEIRIT